MLRRLFTLLSAVSLVLYVATAAAWVRSYFPERLWAIGIDGRLIVVGLHGPVEGTDKLVKAYSSVRWLVPKLEEGAIPEEGRAVLGVRFSGGMVTATEHPDGFAFDKEYGWPYWMVSIPYAYALLPWLVLPCWWAAAAAVRRRRTRLGRCPGCGYDLRATPGRCPECGAVPAKFSSDADRPPARPVP